jgi:hypothetical protein
VKIHTDGPRERLMLMGATGSGKSQAAISIAKMTDNPMYVIDTEWDNYERLAYGADDLDNLVIYPCMPDDWTAQRDALNEIMDRLKRDDWLVVDSTTPTWQAVQTWFGDLVMGDNLENLMLKARQELSDGSNVNPYDGWTDWSVINAQYAAFSRKFFKANQKGAHVLLTAELDVLQDDADRAVRAEYGKWGAKPKGQKRLPYIPHDLLFMRRLKSGWEMDTVKARGERAEVDSLKLVDFAKQYLMGVAGWKVDSAVQPD